jgi:hypothetical protein
MKKFWVGATVEKSYFRWKLQANLALIIREPVIALSVASMPPHIFQTHMVDWQSWLKIKF